MDFFFKTCGQPQGVYVLIEHGCALRSPIDRETQPTRKFLPADSQPSFFAWIKRDPAAVDHPVSQGFTTWVGSGLLIPSSLRSFALVVDDEPNCQASAAEIAEHFLAGPSWKASKPAV